MYKQLLLIVLLLVKISNAYSSTVVSLPGADDGDFLSAVEVWLDDNDEDSLPVFSSLAHDGNVAARLLLSRIEITDRASGDFVKSLSRVERHDLFRQKSGDSVFRPSWLRIESNFGNPFAIIMNRATELGIDMTAIGRLYESGEIEASEHLIRKIAVDGSQADRSEVVNFINPNSELIPYLRGFLYARNGMTTGKAALQHMTSGIYDGEVGSTGTNKDLDTENAIKFVDIGYQAGSKIFDYGQSNKYFLAIANWVLSAPETTAIANLCRDACKAQDLPSCANTALGLVGGYYEAIRYDSPLENIISQSRFLTSKRATNMSLRKIASSRTDAGDIVFSDRELKEKSRCLADVIAKGGF